MTPTLQGVPLTGLRLGAPLGSGAHGVVWAATTMAGEQVAVRVLPDVGAAAHAVRARRLAVLRGLAHPCLARVLPMPEDTDERLLVSELVTGPALATLRAGRMGISAKEALAIARDLAGALALLHEHGIVHGDVAPGNVLLSAADDEGSCRPVLVDLAGDLGWEAGTSGFAAPEVREGRVAGPPSDIWSLATLCAWATRVGERDEVVAALGSATAEEPAERPSAADLAARLSGRRLVDVRVPPASVLAGAALREQRQRAATVLRPARRRPRHRRPGRRGWLVGLAASLTLVLVGLWLLHPDGAVAPRNAAPYPASSDLVQRVEELVALRDEALAAADADALAQVSAVDSPARAEDAAVLASLAAEGTTVAGLRTDVSDVQVLGVTSESARVRAVLTQAPHERLIGSSVREVPAQDPRCVELTLARAAGVWVVESASGCDR